MMAQAFSPDPNVPLTLDASVVINLNASGQGRTVLCALANPIVVVDVVQGEIGRGSQQRRNDKAALAALVADGVVSIGCLEGEAVEIFESLVIGPAISTLDDGEAATIAHAVYSGAIAVVDERKATLLSQRRFPQLATLSTMDLFASASVRNALGPELFSDTIFMALVHGRMQVPKQHLGWVIELVGPDRAIQCLSLPSFVRASSSGRDLGLMR